MCTYVPQIASVSTVGIARTQADTLQLVSSPLLVGILPSDYASICASARPKVFARGEMLYFKGDSVQQVMLLTSGSVKLTQFGASGTEVILSVLTPGEVLGAMGLLTTGKHCTAAQVFRLCRVLTWEARAFKAWMDRSLILHQNMVNILSRDLVDLEERFQELATERVASRVARQVLRLREKIGSAIEGGIEISLSRQELAQMTGTTLFTVSRLLSAWEELGIVKASRETVTICDAGALHCLPARLMVQFRQSWLLPDFPSGFYGCSRGTTWIDFNVLYSTRRSDFALAQRQALERALMISRNPFDFVTWQPRTRGYLGASA